MSSNAKTLLNTNEDADFLNSLREDFYVETLDSFEKSESILIELEANQNELKKLEYKRILHSIKGSAKAVDENKFAKIIHIIEDSLSCVTTESMDFQLKFLDVSTVYIRMRMQGDHENAEKQLTMIEEMIKT